MVYYFDSALCKVRVTWLDLICFYDKIRFLHFEKINNMWVYFYQEMYKYTFLSNKSNANLL